MSENAVNFWADPKVKGVLWGCGAGIAAGVLLMGIIAGAISGGKVPIWMIKGIGLGISCIMAGTAGFAGAKVGRKRGFFVGLACGGILAVVEILLGVSVGESLGTWTGIKVFSMLIAGAVCGSMGVVSY